MLLYNWKRKKYRENDTFRLDNFLWDQIFEKVILSLQNRY